MKKLHNLISSRYGIAKFAASFFTLALCICANTNSSIMAHQPKCPKGIDRYKLWS